jgi:hypothetical protein
MTTSRNEFLAPRDTSHRHPWARATYQDFPRLTRVDGSRHPRRLELSSRTDLVWSIGVRCSREPRSSKHIARHRACRLLHKEEPLPLRPVAAHAMSTRGHGPVTSTSSVRSSGAVTGYSGIGLLQGGGSSRGRAIDLRSWSRPEQGRCEEDCLSWQRTALHLSPETRRTCVPSPPRTPARPE